MDEYKYLQLNGTTSFRLLHVSASSTNNLICTHLEETSLEEKPGYYALSYVWGTDDAKWPLRIGKQNILIQTNLLHALQRLRKLGYTAIWIDAVCINQTDFSERAHQITIMRQIYESAIGVIVHLGESEDASQLRIPLLSLEKLAISLLQHSFNSTIAPVSWNILQQHYGLLEPEHEAWQSLIHLANHAWFRRVWTFQEILVARMCLFICSDWQMLSNNFLPIFNAIRRSGISKYVDQVQKMRLSSLDMAGQRCASILLRQQADPEHGWLRLTWKRSPLIQLLCESRNWESTDPRDRIYALVGISCEADEEELKPCYKETPDQTFYRVAQYFVKRGYGAQLLENATFGSLHSLLPSWVPRWDDLTYRQTLFPSYQASYVNDSAPTSSAFNASRRTKAAFRLNGIGDVLIGRGVIFDCVKSIGSAELLMSSVESVPDGGVDSMGTYWLTLQFVREIFGMLIVNRRDTCDPRALFRAIGDIALCQRQHLTDEKSPNPLSRGLIIHIRAHKHAELEKTSTQYLRLALMAVLSGVEVTPENRELAVQFQRLAFSTFSRCLRCYTQKGYVGQVLSNARVGDKIALLMGCKVPYVLREVTTHQYRLISNCYIHGIMDGEAWPHDDTDIGDIQII